MVQSGHLHLRARTLIEGLHGGRHRTAHRGGSTEFYDYRAYAPGDPISMIDWKVYGRTDRDYVRRFQHESQLTVMLVVDASASMRFAALDEGASPRSRRPSKLDRALELAAALAYFTIRQGDRCGLVVPRVGRDAVVIPPGAGMPHLHRVIERLERVRARGQGGLGDGLEICAGMLRESGLVICIGDGLEDVGPIADGAARVRYGAGGRASMLGGRQNRGSEVALLQVLTADELSPQPIGSALLVDPESGAEIATDTGAVAGLYREQFGEHQRSLRAGFEAAGGRCVLCRVDRPAEEALRDFLLAR